MTSFADTTRESSAALIKITASRNKWRAATFLAVAVCLGVGLASATLVARLDDVECMTLFADEGRSLSACFMPSTADTNNVQRAARLMMPQLFGWP